MLINKNEVLNGIEVSFDAKPSTRVLDVLKTNGFRWHKVKKIWYAKETEQRLSALEALKNGVVSPSIKKEVANKYGVKVGDIFLLSFGYSMTLYDFFQVVSVTESSCRVVEISVPCCGGSGFNPRFKAELGKKYPRSDRSQWVKDQTKGDLKRVGVYNGSIHISIGDHWAMPYDGREVEEDHWD